MSSFGSVISPGVTLYSEVGRWRQRRFSYFKTLGIPGPEPSLLWGNLREYHETHYFKVIGKWLDNYGDTFGFYNGDVPFVVTKDLDFLEYIFIRNFQNFTDRGDEMVMEQRHPLLRNGIVYAEGSKWRNIRRSLASAFTHGKLKQMMADVKKGADTFLDIVSEYADSNREANVFELYQRLAMDYVGRTAFGVDFSFQRGPENALAASSKAILRGVMKGPFYFICQCTSTFGVFAKPLYWINMLLGVYASVALTKETANVIDLRRNNPEEELDYETVTKKLPYLSQVVSEALRLYPPVLTFTSRKAVNDFEHNGVQYKAGTCFSSPILQVHRDARYWPDPLNFNPDRFSPDNESNYHKVAYQAFGIGPRNCIGMRMAHMVLYSTIARLVQRFRLDLGPSQEKGPLEIVSQAIVSKPSNGPWILFRRI
ncbi:cytochrome P450 3A14-like [Rhipicephalus microplus]|uniref:cytochrome P450 3A14-like n=1 Tax=Rhipicephalus microplus TaxID=6941 RepID=UPI003F6A6EB0